MTSLSRTIPAILFLSLGSVPAGHAAGPAALSCEAARSAASAHYASCMARAEERLPDGESRYARTVARCSTRFYERWEQISVQSAARGSECPAEPVASDVRDHVDLCLQSVVEAAVSGTGLSEVTADSAEAGSAFESGSGTSPGDSSGRAVCSVGTAVPGYILAGRTVTRCDGTTLTGTLPNRSTVNYIPSAADQYVLRGFYPGTTLIVGDADLAPSNILAGKKLWNVTGTLRPSRPLKTGETTCYNKYGESVVCTGTGQDGDLKKGVTRSYTDNGNGTITDNATGLIWEKLSDNGDIHDKDNGYLWESAFTKVANLNKAAFGGYTDWRVPNRFELETLIDLKDGTPTFFSNSCSAGCSVLSCSCVGTGAAYWSSSHGRTDPKYKWTVSWDGDVILESATLTLRPRLVRAVRG